MLAAADRKSRRVKFGMTISSGERFVDGEIS